MFSFYGHLSFSTLRKEMVSPSPNSIIYISCFFVPERKEKQNTKIISLRSFLHSENHARMELSAV